MTRTLPALIVRIWENHLDSTLPTLDGSVSGSDHAPSWLTAMGRDVAVSTNSSVWNADGNRFA